MICMVTLQNGVQTSMIRYIMEIQMKRIPPAPKMVN